MLARGSPRGALYLCRKGGFPLRRRPSAAYGCLLYQARRRACHQRDHQRESKEPAAGAHASPPESQPEGPVPPPDGASCHLRLPILRTVPTPPTVPYRYTYGTIQVHLRYCTTHHYEYMVQKRVQKRTTLAPHSDHVCRQHTTCVLAQHPVESMYTTCTYILPYIYHGM